MSEHGTSDLGHVTAQDGDYLLNVADLDDCARSRALWMPRRVQGGRPYSMDWERRDHRGVLVQVMAQGRLGLNVGFGFPRAARL